MGRGPTYLCNRFRHMYRCCIAAAGFLDTAAPPSVNPVRLAYCALSLCDAALSPQLSPALRQNRSARCDLIISLSHLDRCYRHAPATFRMQSAIAAFLPYLSEGVPLRSAKLKSHSSGPQFVFQ